MQQFSGILKKHISLGFCSFCHFPNCRFGGSMLLTCIPVCVQPIHVILADARYDAMRHRTFDVKQCIGHPHDLFALEYLKRQNVNGLHTSLSSNNLTRNGGSTVTELAESHLGSPDGHHNKPEYTIDTSTFPNQNGYIKKNSP